MNAGNFLRFNQNQYIIKNILSKNDDHNAEIATEASRIIFDELVGGKLENIPIGYTISSSKKAVALAINFLNENKKAVIHGLGISNASETNKRSLTTRLLFDENANQYVAKKILTLGGIPELKDKNAYFEISKDIYLEDVATFLIKRGLRDAKSFDPEVFSAKRRIIPDGAVLSISNANYQLPLFVGEMKHQGTNKKRISEGKAKQAVGNAIERASKNMNLVKTLFKGSNVFPYTMFCWGDDFVDSETVRSKLIAMNGMYPLNQNNSEAFSKDLAASIYYQEQEWLVEDILDKETQIVIGSLKYVVALNQKLNEDHESNSLHR